MNKNNRTYPLEKQICINFYDRFCKEFPNHLYLLVKSISEVFKLGPQAYSLKAQGWRAGVPDYLFLVPTKKHPFLALEFKTQVGRLSPAQKIMKEELEKVGARFEVPRSADEGINIIKNYLI